MNDNDDELKIQNLKEIINDNDNDKHAHYQLAELLRGGNDYDGAKKHYLSAIRIDNNYSIII